MMTKLNALAVLTMLLTAFIPPAFSQQPLGLFDGHTDVGSVKIPGSATYNAETQAYFINGSGANMWADRDEFHFVWKQAGIMEPKRPVRSPTRAEGD